VHDTSALAVTRCCKCTSVRSRTEAMDDRQWEHAVVPAVVRSGRFNETRQEIPRIGVDRSDPNGGCASRPVTRLERLNSAGNPSDRGRSFGSEQFFRSGAVFGRSLGVLRVVRLWAPNFLSGAGLTDP
jgi:hypothetical protein